MGLWVSHDDTAAYQLDTITQLSLRRAAPSRGHDKLRQNWKKISKMGFFALKELNGYTTGLVEPDTPFYLTFFNAAF